MKLLAFIFEANELVLILTYSFDNIRLHQNSFRQNHQLSLQQQITGERKNLTVGFDRRGVYLLLKQKPDKLNYTVLKISAANKRELQTNILGFRIKNHNDNKHFHTHQLMGR